MAYYVQIVNLRINGDEDEENATVVGKGTEDPGKLYEIPEPESGHFGRFLALMSDLFDRKIRTYGPKTTHWPERNPDMGREGFVRGRHRVRTDLGCPHLPGLLIDGGIVITARDGGWVFLRTFCASLGGVSVLLCGTYC